MSDGSTAVFCRLEALSARSEYCVLDNDNIVTSARRNKEVKVFLNLAFDDFTEQELQFPSVGLVSPPAATCFEKFTDL